MMREWVPHFLVEQMNERGGNISEEEYLREIAIPHFAFNRLAQSFNTFFSGNERMCYLLGSTLGDLTGDAFLTFRAIPGLVFILWDKLGFVLDLSWVQRAPLVVGFKDEILTMDDWPARGVVAHELGHLCRGHYQHTICLSEYEQEADDWAKGQGFEEEIKAVRTYLKQKGERENVKR
jgi:hypothetical protein